MHDSVFSTLGLVRQEGTFVLAAASSDRRERPIHSSVKGGQCSLARQMPKKALQVPCKWCKRSQVPVPHILLQCHSDRYTAAPADAHFLIKRNRTGSAVTCAESSSFLCQQGLSLQKQTAGDMPMDIS